jgi:hypothetical protein
MTPVDFGDNWSVGYAVTSVAIRRKRMLRVQRSACENVPIPMSDMTARRQVRFMPDKMEIVGFVLRARYTAPHKPLATSSTCICPRRRSV